MKGQEMKCIEGLEEEIEFWLEYISRWDAIHNKPIPDRVQQLMNNRSMLNRVGTLLKRASPTRYSKALIAKFKWLKEGQEVFEIPTTSLI
jgi:hypothetical protein